MSRLAAHTILAVRNAIMKIDTNELDKSRNYLPCLHRRKEFSCDVLRPCKFFCCAFNLVTERRTSMRAEVSIDNSNLFSPRANRRRIVAGAAATAALSPVFDGRTKRAASAGRTSDISNAASRRGSARRPGALRRALIRS